MVGRNLRKNLKASIILVTWSPTKERLDLLKKSLVSLRESTDVEYELIAVDNGPAEQTDFLKTQKIDKLITNEKNRGIGFGRNQAMRCSTGDYIAFVDNDLIFMRDWLGESIEALEKYPEKKFIASAFHSFYHQKPMNFRGMLDEYFIWGRGSPAGLVMKRDDAESLGEWVTHPKPGTKLLNTVKRRGYLIISLPFSKITHCGIGSSYDHADLMRNGKWKEEWSV